MDKKMIEALNDQLNYELYSAYIYFAMAAYFDSANLPGFASWMKMQAQEEMVHVMKFYDYLNNRGAKVILAAVLKPASTFLSAKDVFKKSLAHEKGVTARINKLYELARKVKDTTTEVMLQWFVTEQLEEEKSVSDVIVQLDMVKADSAALLILDRDLAKRAAPQPQQA
jgi:ferritin